MTPGQLLYRHKKGATLDELASETGLSRYQIYRRITAERWRYGEVVISERALRKDIKAGLTVRQIADKNFCSVGCISKKMKAYGIKTRPPGNPSWAKKKCEQNEKD